MSRRSPAGLALVTAFALAIPLAQGSVAAALVRPAAPTTGSSGTATAGTLLRPDLVALPARSLWVQTVGGVRRLRFGSVLGNVGPGPVEIHQNQGRRCPSGQHNATQVIYRDANGDGAYEIRKDTEFVRRRAGCMIYHPEHHHWHFQASARYVLLDPGTDPATVVAARRKVSFCLRDSERLPPRYGDWSYPQTYGACSARSRQGLSVGWSDLYQNYLAGQALKLPRRLPNGLYCLRTVVDPLHKLIETDDANNSAVRAFSLKGERVRARPASRCR